MTAITIRNVPQEVRDELAARAGRSGRSLQEYVRGMLVETASRPTLDDVLDRAAARVAAAGTRLSVDEIVGAVHADRR